MDTKELEKFCPWARRELIKAVDLRCRLFALDPDGLATAPADSDVLGSRVLSAQEKSRRIRLAERIDARGYDVFCQEEAYAWFNRFVAIRYMELHDYLPCRMRILSSASDGSFDPDCIRQAADLDLPGLDTTEILKLMTAGEDEEIFRRVIIAQCNELARCLPEVFGQVDAADALTLPNGLTSTGDQSFLYHLVNDIPESAWDDVEVLGWMYQFYNAELKNEFFKSKRKASAADIAPATQLFTPEWIVRYMVENSLGRLWMLNHPESRLRERMEYYIEPDADHEDFIRVESPEDLTLCDPACGSGHILSYAFELLYAIYEECGYVSREIPELILTKNLSGYEVDPRAAQIASLVLALRAREHDRRFFRRDVRADVRVLESVPLEEGETGLPKKLAEELSHLGEIGSLLVPTDEDMDAIRAELASRAGDLFAAATKDGLEGALEACKALRRRFDVVVANPPYMGSSSFNPFMSGWVKKNYPDVKSDLCTCFIERVLSLAAKDGFSALVTSDTCMYLSSFEALRNKLIDESTLLSLVDTRGTNAHPDVFDANAVWVLQNGHHNGYEGAYFKLNHRIGEKDAALLEAIKNPACGWFYRRDASTFHQIPGSPIAYWASEGLLKAFSDGRNISSESRPHIGIQTGDNVAFIRKWWEPSLKSSSFTSRNVEEAVACRSTWFPIWKGGQFRKWAGNREELVNWRNDGEEIIGNAKRDQRRVMNLPNKMKFCPTVCWSMVSSSFASFRMYSAGGLVEHASSGLYEPNVNPLFLIALCNSSVARECLLFLSPTLNFEVNKIGALPLLVPNSTAEAEAAALASNSISLSNEDWDSLETSWDFKRSPLV